VDHQEVNTIRGQFQAGQWPQFLQMVSIAGLRGWTGQSVEFNYPIVAVVGENGSAKVTGIRGFIPQHSSSRQCGIKSATL
jgi:predicted ATPase